MVHITVGQEVAALIPTYIEKRKSEIPTLHSCLENERFQDIANIARNAKGTAANHGFLDLTMIASKMEMAAKKSDSASLAVLIGQFKEYIENVTWEVKGKRA